MAAVCGMGRKVKKIIISLIALNFVLFGNVYAYDTIDYSDELADLKKLIEECEMKGIKIDYENINYNVIERFVGYINDDIQNYPGSNKDEMVEYNISCMDSLYDEAKRNLEAYLDGTKVPYDFEKNVMTELSTDGAAVKDKNGAVISVGYGHGGMVRNDVSNLPDFGTNNVQIELGPTAVYEKADWNKLVKNDPECTYAIDSNTYYSGKSSGKITFNTEGEADHYILLHQTVNVKPGKTYVLKGKVKAENLTGGFMCVNTWSRDCSFKDGTYDWTEYSHEYTVPTGVNSVVVRLFIDNKTDSVNFDDFSFCEKNTTNNLIYNGGFEKTTEAKYIFAHNSANLKTVLGILNSAEENNVGVTLLLSPHYMLNHLSSDAYNSSAYHFIKYNINHPEVKAFLEDYINNLMPYLSNYKALKSICISNEPLFCTTDYYSFYNPLFRDYLKEIHGDIETLNKKYGTSYPSFSWVYMPMGELRNRDALAYDWMMFNDKVLADWHSWLTELVKEHLPDVPVHSKMMGYFRGSDVEETDTKWLAYGTDLELLGESSDWAGNDTWDYIDEPNRYYESMFLYDYQLSVHDKPVYNSEDHIIADRNAEFSENQRLHLRNNLWMGAVHGRSLSTVWIWERSYDTSSDFYNSILFRPDAVAEVGKTNLDFARLRNEISKLQQAQPEVALYYSKPSRLYDSLYLKNLFEVYKEILNSGQKVGIVSDNCIEKLSEYNVVILPGAAYGTDKAYEALKLFDGEILYSGELFAYDEYKNLRDNSELTEKSYRLESGTIYEYFERFGISDYKLIDEESGKMPDNIEWSYVIDNNKVLFNITNIEYDNIKNIALYRNGKKIEGIKNLITGESNISAVKLSGYTPVLLQYENSDFCPAEIDSISYNPDDETIVWTYTGDYYNGANIYKMGDAGNQFYVGSVSDTSYNCEGEGTYIVRAVYDDGTESEGQIITVTKEKVFTVVIENVTYKNGYVTCDIVTQNNDNSVSTGVTVVNVKDSDGKILNSSYYKHTFPILQADRIRVSMPSRGDAATVQVYAADSIESELIIADIKEWGI